MRTGLKKFFAILIILTSSLGLLLSVFFLIQIWRYRQPAANLGVAALDQTSTILKTTGDGLDVLDQVVNNVYSSTIYLQDTTTSLVNTMQSTNQFIGSTGTFLGVDLVSTITNTQVALSSAQSSAGVIDNILTALSRIPFIGLTYNPTLPLNTALGGISTSLDPLKESLRNFQTSLETTQTNIKQFNTQIKTFDQNISDIKKNLTQASSTIENYQLEIKSITSSVDRAKISLPSWVGIVTWLLTLIIVWFIFTQIGMIIQGINDLSPGHREPPMVENPGPD